jgi:hypothetical protein
MRSKVLLVMALVAALLSCKMVDAVKKRVMGATASSSAAAGSATPPPAAVASAAPSDGKVVPAPTHWKAAPLAVGQHCRYRIKYASGKVAIVEYKIVGKKDGAYWMELDDTHPATHETRMFQVLLTIPDRTSAKGVDVKGLRMKVGGRIQEFHGAMMRAIQKGTNKYLRGLAIPQLDGKPQEDKTVEAGTFKGCYKWNAKEHLAGMTEEGVHWNHPAVPILTLVKSELADGGSVELLDYGMTGAKAGF